MLEVTLRKGETIAFVGASGCGKSTILKLLMGFYEADSGIIKVYGRKISEWNLNALRSLITTVFQDLFVFPASIKMNLTAVREGVTEDELTHALSCAELSEYIEQLPEGVETILGERGVNVSGGQRQRIAIARAFIKNAPIFVFDEATAALDGDSEQKINMSMAYLGNHHTLIVVAHRLSTAKRADRIIVIEEGKIMEQGNHKALMLLEGRYCSLWNEQMKLHSNKIRK